MARSWRRSAASALRARPGAAGRRPRHGGEAVHRAVMQLGVDHKAAALQALDQVIYPKRPRAVERHGVQTRHQLAQLRHIARLRQRKMTHMMVEIDVVDADPRRMIEAE